MTPATIRDRLARSDVDPEEYITALLYVRGEQ